MKKVLAAALIMISLSGCGNGQTNKTVPVNSPSIQVEMDSSKYERLLTDFDLKVISIDSSSIKTAPVFNVEFSNEIMAPTKPYFKNIIYQIAKMSHFKDFKLQDQKKNIVIEVDSDPDSNSVKEIKVNGDKNIIDALSLNKLTDQEIKVLDFLNKNVPEIEGHKKMVEKASQKQTTVIPIIEREPDASGPTDYYKNYYKVYVGEISDVFKQTAEWNTFYVHKDFKDILFLDPKFGKIITVQEWRKLRAQMNNESKEDLWGE
ncbi:MAG: hypothetical protein N2645_02535 [Clostridia bacterium]|nr:hypothetical protein [Clostridia bacterium]